VQETQDSIDDVILYWWTNDVLYKEIAAQVDHLKKVGRFHIHAVLKKSIYIQGIHGARGW